jgi:hypothetical protein
MDGIMENRHQEVNVQGQGAKLTKAGSKPKELQLIPRGRGAQVLPHLHPRG